MLADDLVLYFIYVAMIEGYLCIYISAKMFEAKMFEIKLLLV